MLCFVLFSIILMHNHVNSLPFVFLALPYGFSHQEERWSEDHSERDKRQAEWDFSKDNFFCDVPGTNFKDCIIGTKCYVHFILPFLTAKVSVKHLDYLHLRVCMHAKTSSKVAKVHIDI